MRDWKLEMTVAISSKLNTPNGVKGFDFPALHGLLHSLRAIPSFLSPTLATIAIP